MERLLRDLEALDAHRPSKEISPDLGSAARRLRAGDGRDLSHRSDRACVERGKAALAGALAFGPGLVPDGTCGSDDQVAIADRRGRVLSPGVSGPSGGP